MVRPSETDSGWPGEEPSDAASAGDEGILDRESDVPLYFQLAAALKVRLEVEPWKAGARFASEREIEEEFGVSRAVIRPALELLVGDGAIYRVKGSGAFVAPPRREIRVTGLVGLWSGPRDERPVVVASARMRQPDHTVSHFLELKDRLPPVAHVTAIVDVGEPSVCLVDSFSSVAHVPWLFPTAESLRVGTKPPEPVGLELTRATVSVEHTHFGEWGSSQVGAAAGEPALMGRFVQFGRPEGSEVERPVEFARVIYRADSAQLAFELS